MSQIESLTPEQIEAIPQHRDKWRSIALSNQPADIEQATTSIQTIYKLLELPEPQIYFHISPLQAMGKFNLDFWGSETIDIESHLLAALKTQLDNTVWNRLQQQLYEALHRQLWDNAGYIIYSSLNKQSQDYHSLNEGEDGDYFNPARDCTPSDYLIAMACLFDYCDSVLNCSFNNELWQAYKSLVTSSGWLWTYEDVCYICERPRIFINGEGQLHADGHCAIEYGDKLRVYAHRGVIIPEKYGAIPVDYWQSRWLLEEDNAELRRVLLQAIGYSKICQELKAEEIDSWKEYRLLKIDENIDLEPIHMLAMTCPSTSHQHTLRVPPDITSAREAIKWVNWDIDPSEFIIQT